MKEPIHSLKAAIYSLAVLASLFPVVAQSANPVASAPVFVPDTSHSSDPLPPGVLAWDQTQKNVDATNGQAFAHFVFALTNVATRPNLGTITNVSYATNIAVVTNGGFWNAISGKKYSHVTLVNTNLTVSTVTNGFSPAPVTVLNVHPSCGCTTAEVPPSPWILPPGTNTTIRVNVNLAGKRGIVPKSVEITTDRGRMALMVIVNIAPEPPPRPLTDMERAQGVAASKVDRQAVFKGDCASCHAKNLPGKYGQQLFALTCAVCHEANPRASMVPDLHNLKDATSEEFWRAWITSGKAGTLMPAFATAQGGPLTDMQIASLAAWLNVAIPSHPAPAQASK
jgi:mono/diheme cytochrome c family protein